MNKLIAGSLLSLCVCSIAMGRPNHASIPRSPGSSSARRGESEADRLAVRQARPRRRVVALVRRCETLDRDYAKFSVYKDYVGELGVKHARIQSGWAKCEKQKGVYEFDWLDECVYGLNQQTVKPWMCLCYGNPIYRLER